MTPRDIIDVINKLEGMFPVDEWVIRNMHVWPLVRMYLKHELFDRHLNIKKSLDDRASGKVLHSLSRLFIRNARLMHSFFSDFKKNSSINESCDALFVGFCVDRVFVDGFFYDKYSDPYIDIFNKLGMKSSFWEMGTGAGEYRIPRYRSSALIQHILDYMSIKSRAGCRNISNNEARLEGYDDLFALILTEADISALSRSDLQYQVAYILNLAAYFKMLLKANKTSIVFSSQYYTNVIFALNLACRELGIKSVDIQHGGAGEYHNAYGRWIKVPDSGYELLPSIFWCWSEHDAQAIYKWSGKVSDFHKPFVGGDMWSNMWKRGDADFIKKLDSDILGMKIGDDLEKVVLYTHDKFYEIPDWLWNAMREASAMYQWVIRMHPTQHDQRDYIAKTGIERGIRNFKTDKVFSDMPLTALFRHIDVHVTATSSSAIEADSFGIPSIAIHKNAEVYHSDLIYRGAVVTAYNAADFHKALETQCKKNKTNESFESNKNDNTKIIADFFNFIKKF